MEANTVIVRSASQVSCPLGDEAAILSLSRGAYFGLEPVGARVWSLIAEPRPFAEIVDAIVGEFDVSREVCARDLDRFVAELRDAGLVEVTDA